jgi:hypothetical protein
MGQAISKLTEDQKARISEVRQKYRAKIAEAELACQSSMAKAAQAGDHESFEEAKKRLLQEKQQLEGKMDREIARIREESGESEST